MPKVALGRVACSGFIGLIAGCWGGDVARVDPAPVGSTAAGDVGLPKGKRAPKGSQALSPDSIKVTPE